VKPAQLLPRSLLLLLALAAPAWGQAAAGTDTEPAAAAPAPPPAPVEAPADLPPPPPPKSSLVPPPPQGKMVISAPPLPAAIRRAGYHVHDGFYLRMAAGIGGGHANVSTNRDASPNFGMGGAGLALNLWIGGTPWTGIAIGGLLSLQGMSDSQINVEGQKYSDSMNGGWGALGAFIDAFPDPQRGLHVGGSLSLLSLSLKADNHALADRGLADYDGGGLGLSAWVGYMGFVGPEWSLGGMLQLMGGVTREKGDAGLQRDGSFGTLSVNFSALYQ
jgi:hypothetical protein